MKNNERKIEQFHKKLGIPLESIRLIYMGALHGINKTDWKTKHRRRIIKQIDILKSLLDDEYFTIFEKNSESPYYQLNNRKQTFDLLNLGRSLNKK